MVDNNLVTHGLHWLTSTVEGWECANPGCNWTYPATDQIQAQRLFDLYPYHAKLSEAPASVPT